MAEYYDPETYPDQWNYLQTGTIIDHYMIERELAHGGFSSVYLARQLADQIQVAIKEYLPRKLAHRTWNNLVVPNNPDTEALFRRGRKLFFEEARALATLKHPNIVRVINFFEANSTVYMVMDYDYGVTLDKILKYRSVSINEEFLLSVFNTLLAGVGHMHSHHFIHLDIKPANILVRPAFDSLLLDFGAIQTFPHSHFSKQIKILTKGFSPIEQYQPDAPIGPWSDIYAIGASMRACLEFRSPLPAPERQKQNSMVPAAKAYKRKYSASLLKAIDWAMEMAPDRRPQSITELQNALSGKCRI